MKLKKTNKKTKTETKKEYAMMVRWRRWLAMWLVGRKMNLKTSSAK